MGRLATLFPLCLLLLLAPAAFAEGGLKARWNDFWWTPAQQGQRAFENGEFEMAATLYRDPMQIGTAYFRAGDFEAASAAFGRVDNPEGTYNLGNAQLMQGNYAGATLAYDRALAARPGWTEAQQNRAIAQSRQQGLEFDNDQRGEATEIGADDVVFDNDAKNNENQDEVTTDSGQGLSDKELRALWLRKAQTSPAVFLKAKFRAQLAAETQQDTAQ